MINKKKINHEIWVDNAPMKAMEQLWHEPGTAGPGTPHVQTNKCRQHWHQPIKLALLRVWNGLDRLSRHQVVDQHEPNLDS